MVRLYGLEGYRDKIAVGSLYVDTERFTPPAGNSPRTYGIGFVGRFSEEKGILQFIGALPGVLSGGRNGMRVAVIGDGELRGAVEAAVGAALPGRRVECPGWVPPEELPAYLQAIRLIVVPSVKEGLPNIVLESMASGCIVLATPVGGVPDLVRDGETGFLLGGNSPEAIEKGIVRALDHPDPDGITGKARMLIADKYSYDAAVERYREVFL
jgi:glycosyltransferase involved in cell wall biosynthesis